MREVEGEIRKGRMRGGRGKIGKEGKRTEG